MFKKHIFISLFALLSFSCSDWLELLPEDDLVSDEFWMSGNDVEAVLANTYGKMAREVKTLLLWGDLRSGMLSEGLRVPSDAARIMRGDITDLNGFARWSFLYRVINGANQIIEFAPDVVNRDPSFTSNDLNRVLSEAYFLRALSYFYLVRVFKEAPLITEPYISDDQDFYPSKAKEPELISLILADLEYAKTIAVPSFSTTLLTKGRANLYSIHALLADVYLWENEYQKAIDNCNVVIANTEYSLLDADAWFQNFYPGNSVSSIFEFQFSTRWSYNSNLYQTFSFNKNREYTINPRVLELFDVGDVRGAGTTYSDKDLTIWKHVGINPVDERLDALNDNNFILYRLADILLMKAEALAELSRFDESVALVNEIRSKRGVADIEAALTIEAMEDLILNEKARELAFEGKYWFDLIRFAKRDNYRRKDKLINSLILNAPADQIPPLLVKFQDPYSWYMPIHNDDLERNTNLVQNPYYQK